MPRQRPKIEQEGFNIIFGLLHKPESDRFKEVKKALGKSSSFDPTAIRRAIVAAEAIAKNTNKTMPPTDFEILSSNLKYGIESTYLKRVYGYFVIWQRQQNENKQKIVDDANKVKKEQLRLRNKAKRIERARQKQQDEKEQKIINDTNRAKEEQRIIDDANKAIKEQISLHEKAEQQERARQKHLDSLNKIANQLHNRIINPETYYQSYRNSTTWQWGKQDWRFSCAAWFSIVTPRLDDEELLERELPGFNSLKQHIANSPFWSRREKLSRECTSLDDDIDKAVEIAFFGEIGHLFGLKTAGCPGKSATPI